MAEVSLLEAADTVVSVARQVDLEVAIRAKSTAMEADLAVKILKSGFRARKGGEMTSRSTMLVRMTRAQLQRERRPLQLQVVHRGRASLQPHQHPRRKNRRRIFLALTTINPQPYRSPRMVVLQFQRQALWMTSALCRAALQEQMMTLMISSQLRRQLLASQCQIH